MSSVSPDAAEVLASAADQRRLSIVEALVEHRAEHPGSEVLSFSELRRRSDIDDKGNFNYHLGELRDHYVEKTDDGYRLTAAGSELAGLLVSSVAEAAYAEPVEGEPCPDCGNDVVVRLASGRARISCPEDHVPFETSVPPGAAAGRDPAELLAIAAHHWQQSVARHVTGYCVHCFGPEAGSFERFGEDDRRDFFYRSRCSRCGLQFLVPPGCVVIRHPAILSLYHRHGRDIRTTPPWKLAFLGTGEYDVTSPDPLRLRVTAEVGDDAVGIVLDREGNVLRSEGP